MRDLVGAVTAELVARFEDEPTFDVLVAFDPAWQVAEDVFMPVLLVCVTAPSLIVGSERVFHGELLNPLTAIDDELLTRVCASVRLAIAGKRHIELQQAAQ